MGLQPPEGMIGRVLGGTFRLVRLIGTGGMGAVYEAEHTRLPRHFAVKVLHREAAFDPETVQRFRREAEIASSLGSPHIVEVIDFNVDADGTPYLVMELLRGENLADRMKRTGPWPPSRAARMIDQVASALQAAHDKGIIHRDLKPPNIFIVQTGDGAETFKVVDFGISKVLHSASLRTNQGSVFGTPHYMAPEQALGNTDKIDARTDVYALGALLYEVLSGRPPFSGTNIAELIFKVLNDAPTSLSSIAVHLPPDLCDVVGCAMAKKAEERFQSVRALRDAFVRSAERGPAQPSRIPPTRIPMRRPESSPAAEALEEPHVVPVTSPPSATASTLPGDPAASAAVETVKPTPRRLARSGIALIVAGAGVVAVAVGAWVWSGSASSNPVVPMQPQFTAAPFVTAGPLVAPPPPQTAALPVTTAPVPVQTAAPSRRSSSSRTQGSRTTSPGPIEDTLGP